MKTERLTRLKPFQTQKNDIPNPLIAKAFLRSFVKHEAKSPFIGSKTSREPSRFSSKFSLMRGISNDMQAGKEKEIKLPPQPISCRNTNSIQNYSNCNSQRKPQFLTTSYDCHNFRTMLGEDSRFKFKVRLPLHSIVASSKISHAQCHQIPVPSKPEAPSVDPDFEKHRNWILKQSSKSLIMRSLFGKNGRMTLRLSGILGKANAQSSPNLHLQYQLWEELMVKEPPIDISDLPKKKVDAYFMAVKDCREEILSALIDETPKLVHARDSIQQTGLHWAAKRNYSNIITLLIEQKARINAQDIAGKTPLMLAMRSSKYQAARSLMIAEASPLVATKSDLTVLDMQEGDNRRMISDYKTLFVKRGHFDPLKWKDKIFDIVRRYTGIIN